MADRDFVREGNRKGKHQQGGGAVRPGRPRVELDQ